MKTTLFVLLGILLIMLAIILIVVFAILAVRKFLKEYFGTTSLKEAIETSEIADSETQKTVYSMEPVYLEQIKRDFPTLNINELKSSAEANIRNVLHAINLWKIKTRLESTKSCLEKKQQCIIVWIALRIISNVQFKSSWTKLKNSRLKDANCLSEVSL